MLFGLLAGTAVLGARSLRLSVVASRALVGRGLGLRLVPRAVAVTVLTLFAYDVQV
jgi:hypothetical protein